MWKIDWWQVRLEAKETPRCYSYPSLHSKPTPNLVAENNNHFIISHDSVMNWAQLGGSSVPYDTRLDGSPMRVQLAEMSMMLTHIPSTFVGQWKGWVELGYWLLGLSHPMQFLGLSLFTWPLHVVSSLSLSRRVTGFLRDGSGLSEVQKPHEIHRITSSTFY